MIKIIVHTTLSVWLLWISSGVFVYRHYCGTQIQSQNLLGPKSCMMDQEQKEAIERIAETTPGCHALATQACHGTDQPHEEPVKGCCADETLIIRWNDFTGLSPKSAGNLSAPAAMDVLIGAGVLNGYGYGTIPSRTQIPFNLYDPPGKWPGSFRLPFLGSFLI